MGITLACRLGCGITCEKNPFLWVSFSSVWRPNMSLFPQKSLLGSCCFVCWNVFKKSSLYKRLFLFGKRPYVTSECNIRCFTMCVWIGLDQNRQNWSGKRPYVTLSREKHHFSSKKTAIEIEKAILSIGEHKICVLGTFRQMSS